jgi:hypothetical protein
VTQIKYFPFLFRALFATSLLPGRLVCRKTRTGSALMTDATYFRDQPRSIYQHSIYQQSGSNWTVLMGGAATMFAMATLAAVLWV